MQLIDIQKLAKGKSIKFDIKDKNCIVLSNKLLWVLKIFEQQQ